MDGTQFDEFLRRCARTRLTRMSAVRGVAGAALATLLGSPALTRQAQAKATHSRTPSRKIGQANPPCRGVGHPCVGEGNTCCPELQCGSAPNPGADRRCCIPTSDDSTATSGEGPRCSRDDDCCSGSCVEGTCKSGSCQRQCAGKPCDAPDGCGGNCHENCGGGCT